MRIVGFVRFLYGLISIWWSFF